MGTILKAWEEQLALSRAAMREAVEAVPAALRDAKPAADRWSVAGILEHAGLVEGQILKVLAKLALADRFGPEADPAGIDPVAEAARRARSLDRARTLSASLASHPTGLDARAAWERLEEIRAGFLAELREMEDALQGSAELPHPLLGSLNARGWILFAADHEKRHAAQVAETGQALANAPA